MGETHLILDLVLVAPLVCLGVTGVYLQWRGWQIYKRIGDYSIGLVTFYYQLDYPGQNFPGPNVLEAQIAAQPADLQDYVQAHRRRLRHLRWALLSYLGLLLGLGLIFSVVRKLSA
jgi:hypothetical protein